MSLKKDIWINSVVLEVESRAFFQTEGKKASSVYRETMRKMLWFCRRHWCSPLAVGKEAEMLEGSSCTEFLGPVKHCLAPSV